MPGLIFSKRGVSYVFDYGQPQGLIFVKKNERAGIAMSNFICIEFASD